MQKDITDKADVELLVNSFYGRIRADEKLGPIFNAVIQDRWPRHLERMVSFWETVLLEKKTYDGRPFPPHAKLPVSREHFDRWLALFSETLNQHFLGEKAEEARWRAEQMALLFSSKIDYIRKNPGKVIVS